MAKGSDFERDFARQLSLWWTRGMDDSVFWRVSASGGRARTRAKTGKKTDNQYGDICATQTEGMPLMAKTIWELKRGYKKWSPFDVMDKPAKMKKQTLELFWDQVMQGVTDSGKPLEPFLVWRRDQRVACVAMQFSFAMTITNKLKRLWPRPVAAIKTETYNIVVFRLSDFFEWCDPEVFQ